MEQPPFDKKIVRIKLNGVNFKDFLEARKLIKPVPISNETVQVETNTNLPSTSTYQETKPSTKKFQSGITVHLSGAKESQDVYLPTARPYRNHPTLKSLKKCCAVPSCDARDVATFALPRDPSECMMWCEVLHITADQLAREPRVCVRHFAPEHLECRTSGKVSLHPCALPDRNINTLTGPMQSAQDDESNVASSSYFASCGDKIRPVRRYKKRRLSFLYNDNSNIGEDVAITFNDCDETCSSTTAVKNDSKSSLNVLDDNFLLPDDDLEKLCQEYSSINDLLNDAVKTAPPTRNELNFGKISSMFDHDTFSNENCLENRNDRCSPKLNFPDCASVGCRQSAARVFLLMKEKEKLLRHVELLKKDVRQMQEDVYDEDSMKLRKTVCASCEDGRLESFYQCTLSRYDMLVKKCEEKQMALLQG